MLTIPHAVHLTLAAMVLAGPAATTRYYVDDDASAGGDGLSWATAFQSPEEAFALAQPKDVIWMAEGTYLPTVRLEPADPRSVTFHVPQGVRLYGGFDATETKFSQRAGLFDQTHLSGDVGVAGDPTDNAYHVVWVVHPSGAPPGATRVDGFRISGGRADGSQANSSGGGVHCFNSALRLDNCRIENNTAVYGGGVHVQPGSLRMRWCTIERNRASSNGGGLWSHLTNMMIFSVEFSRNDAGKKGGGVYLHSSMHADSNKFTNVVLRDNSASNGGGIYLGGSVFSSGTGVFRNCTIAFNRALAEGGGIRTVTHTFRPALCFVHNTIVWGNQAPVGPGIHGRAVITYSDLQDGAHGKRGSFSVDPGFVSVPGRNLRLAPGSVCIDAGWNRGVGADAGDLDDDNDKDELTPFDLDHAPRFRDDPNSPDTGAGTSPLVDLGAYEVQG